MALQMGTMACAKTRRCQLCDVQAFGESWREGVGGAGEALGDLEHQAVGSWNFGTGVEGSHGKLPTGGRHWGDSKEEMSNQKMEVGAGRKQATCSFWLVARGGEVQCSAQPGQGLRPAHSAPATLASSAVLQCHAPGPRVLQWLFLCRDPHTHPPQTGSHIRLRDPCPDVARAEGFV